MNATSGSNSTRGVLAGKPLGVFGYGDGTYMSAFSLYRMILGTGAAGNGKPERDLIPALDLAGVPGLYDQVNDRFFACTNGTPLIAGNLRPAARFGRVVDTTPTFAFRRSVAVAATAAEAVTLAFANPDGAAYTLCVASGTQDCGERKLAWDAFMEITDIAADATSYTYTLPAALKVPGTFYRFFLLQKNNLPYLTELVSMSSAVTSDSSAQTVRLDYIPDMRTAIDFRFGNCSYAAERAVDRRRNGIRQTRRGSDDPLGLTDEAVAALACTVVDAAGEDYSEIVTPAIVGGKLVLKNARPSGLTLIVR